MNSAEQSHSSNRTQGDPTNITRTITLTIRAYLQHCGQCKQSRLKGQAGFDPREREPQLVPCVFAPLPPPS